MKRVYAYLFLVGALTVAAVAIVYFLTNRNVVGVTDGFRHDHSTPQGAILCLDDAYRAQDIDAAAACRDFEYEARLLLRGIQPTEPIEEYERVLRAQTRSNEYHFRLQLHQQGFPDLTGVRTTFGAIAPWGDEEDVVIVTIHRHRQGQPPQTERWGAVKSNGQWRVISPPVDIFLEFG